LLSGNSSSQPVIATTFTAASAKKMKSTDQERAPGVPVRALLAEAGQQWNLELVAGKGGLERRILAPRIQKPGLALAGYVRQIHPGRVQVIGTPELSYLHTMSPLAARRAIERVCAEEIACFIITNDAAVPSVLRRTVDKYRVALLRTPLKSAVLIRTVTGWLEEKLAPRISVHGVLVQVLGLGLLIIGKSGIGKSEAALDLIARGHRLVADDVVEVAEVSPLVLKGRSPQMVQHHMEIHGLGIINIGELFGTLATVAEQQIDLVVELVEWGANVDRLGLEDQRYAILDVSIPMVRLPVSPGRNLAILIEVAARNQTLKARGAHAAQRFASAVDREIRRAAHPPGDVSAS
jgi:HPr kinase/phosphorylase